MTIPVIGSDNGLMQNRQQPLSKPMMTQLTDAYINGLVQERRNSSELAMELRLFFALTHRYEGHWTSMC